MKQKYFKLLIIALAVAVVVPQVALAAWWNPFSWGIWNRVFHFQRTEQRQERSTPSPTPANTDQTKNWETYKNTEYGFEFKYPKNEKIEENIFSNPILRLEFDNFKIIIWDNPKNLNFADYFNPICEVSLAKGAKGGFTPYMCNESYKQDKKGNIKGFAVYDANGWFDFVGNFSEKKYFVEFVNLKSYLGEKNNNAENLNQIISTFKFLPIAKPSCSSLNYKEVECIKNSCICEGPDCRVCWPRTPDTACKDSDGGLNYDVKGKTGSGSNPIYVDYCPTNNIPNALIEYTCAGDNITGVVSGYYVCPKGCNDGARIK